MARRINRAPPIADEWPEVGATEEGEPEDMPPEPEARPKPVPVAQGRIFAAPSPSFSPDPAPIQVDLPIWEDAPEAEAAGAYQIKIQRMTPQGDREDLGHLPALTTQLQLVSTFPKAAIYFVMPVDSFGRKLRADPYRIVIPPDHPGLRAVGNTSTPIAPPSDNTIPKVVEILQGELQAVREEKQRLANEIAEERKHLAQERDRVAQERLSLAVQTVTDNNELQAKILERASRRDDAAQSSIVQILAQQQQAADANFQRQLASGKQEQEYRLEMIKAQMEADRAKAGIEREERLRREKEDREERLRRDKEDRDQRDQREKERQENEERRREQDRAYNERMLSMMKSQADPITSLVKTVGQLEPVSDVLRSLFGGGKNEEEEAKPKTWIESLAGLASTFIKAQVEIKKAEAAAMLGQEEAMSEEEEEAMIAAQQQAQIPQAPTPIQLPPAVAAPVVQTASQALSATVSERTKTMEPAMQKAGRRAIKALVEQLRTTPEGDWASKIIGALSADASIYHYVKAVGIRTACKEAGADDDLAGRITATIDASGLVPGDVPRN